MRPLSTGAAPRKGAPGQPDEVLSAVIFWRRGSRRLRSARMALPGGRLVSRGFVRTPPARTLTHPHAIFVVLVPGCAPHS